MSFRPAGLAAALVLLAFDASIAQERHVTSSSLFDAADPNGDGGVSKAEYRHVQTFLLLSIDQNNDGKVSAIEWKDWDPRDILDSEVPIGQLVAAMGRLFLVYDLNKDDYLSAEELTQGLFAPFESAAKSRPEMTRSEFEESFLLPRQIRQ